MKDTTKHDLEKIVERIQEGSFSGIELRALFCILRWEVGGSSILYDISNFFAHEGKRDRGILYNEVKNTVEKFISFMKQGGSYRVHGALFSQTEIIDTIFNFLESQKVNGLNKEAFIVQGYTMMNSILDIVAETEIDLKEAQEVLDIESCRIAQVQDSPDGRVVGFTFKLNPTSRESFGFFAQTVTLPFLKSDRY